MPINWCPSCKTGLANEEVVNGKCERCGADVTKKNLRQWMLKITAYADRLLADLDKLDWPEKVKKMQAEWIGKSHGAEVNFKVDGRDDEITVYTTRPDTLHGATFMVLAPEHELAKDLATDETREAVEEYIYQASLKSSVDRMQDKERQVYLQEAMRSTRSMEQKYQSGYLIMYLQITVQERSCVYQRTMTVTLNLLRSLTFRSFRLSLKMVKRLRTWKKLTQKHLVS